MKSDIELKQAGYTESGAKRFIASSTAFCEELFSKSIALGDRDKAPDAPREVTHEHVRSAAIAIAERGRPSRDPASIGLQVGEYLTTALAGVGGGHLDLSWGVALFGLSLTAGVVMFVIRNLRSRAA